jgi:hypothetical protein
MGRGTDLGEFIIESIAGHGGMGVVYRARQKTPDRIVAPKVISVYAPESGRIRTGRALVVRVGGRQDRCHALPPGRAAGHPARLNGHSAVRPPARSTGNVKLTIDG